MISQSEYRAVARYENLGGEVVLGWDNVPPWSGLSGWNLSSKRGLNCLGHGLRRPRRKEPSLHCRNLIPNFKFLGTAEAYFVCHIGPSFQISLIFAFICARRMLSGWSCGIWAPKEFENLRGSNCLGGFEGSAGLARLEGLNIQKGPIDRSMISTRSISYLSREGLAD